MQVDAEHEPGVPHRLMEDVEAADSEAAEAESGGGSSSGHQQQRSIEDLSSTHGEVEIPDDASASSSRFSFRLLWAYTGPGWLMSIAYLDPSFTQPLQQHSPASSSAAPLLTVSLPSACVSGNLESDLQAGAYTGYQLAWVLLLATAVGLLLQILACRLGVVSGRHLAEVCKAEYPRRTVLALWVMTELAIIGSDIQEVVGSAIAFKLLFGLELWIGVLITGCDTFTFLLLHYLGIRKLEAFFAALIATMCVCFAINFGAAAPSPKDIAGGFIPYFHSYATFQAVGIIGAVIMPHNLFLHSALVQSRRIDRASTAKMREANFYFSIESAVALFVSFLINLIVVCVFAAAFFDPTCALSGQALWKKTGQCQEVGLAEAGDALQSALGGAAQTVWAIGLLAAGQSSTMTGTYAGQFVMSGMISLQFKPWQRVAVTRAIALVPAIFVAVLSSTNGALADSLDQYLNILQSVQLPFAVLPLLRFTSSAAIMGEFCNRAWLSALGWSLSFLLISSNFYLILDFLLTPSSPIPHEPWFYALVAAVGVAYISFITYLVWDDLRLLCRACSRATGRRQADAGWKTALLDSDTAAVNYGSSDGETAGKTTQEERKADAEDDERVDLDGHPSHSSRSNGW